jgi:hypothetical protein
MNLTMKRIDEVTVALWMVVSLLLVMMVSRIGHKPPSPRRQPASVGRSQVRLAVFIQPTHLRKIQHENNFQDDDRMHFARGCRRSGAETVRSDDFEHSAGPGDHGGESSGAFDHAPEPYDVASGRGHDDIHERVHRRYAVADQPERRLDFYAGGSSK